MVDMARKVVGVGSVGTRAWIILLLGRDDNDPLFLQAKEAQPSVLEELLGRVEHLSHGERVVQGQHLMQASSDIFLGWDHVHSVDGVERDYYVRQLRDWKGAAVVEAMKPATLATYSRLCATSLARAHSRSGDRIAIASYLGGSDAFDQAIADFSEAYADQNERDYDSLVQAEKDPAASPHSTRHLSRPAPVRLRACGRPEVGYRSPIPECRRRRRPRIHRQRSRTPPRLAHRSAAACRRPRARRRVQIEQQALFVGQVAELDEDGPQRIPARSFRPRGRPYSERPSMVASSEKLSTDQVRLSNSHMPTGDADRDRQQVEHQHQALHASGVEPDHVALSRRCLAVANSSSVSSPARCIAANRCSSPTNSVEASAPSACGGCDAGG